MGLSLSAQFTPSQINWQQDLSPTSQWLHLSTTAGAAGFSFLATASFFAAAEEGPTAEEEHVAFFFNGEDEAGTAFFLDVFLLNLGEGLGHPPPPSPPLTRTRPARRT